MPTPTRSPKTPKSDDEAVLKDDGSDLWRAVADGVLTSKDLSPSFRLREDFQPHAHPELEAQRSASARAEDRFWNKTAPVSYVVPAPRLLPTRSPSRPSTPPSPLELLPPLLPLAPPAPAPVRPRGADPRLEVLKRELALDEKTVERLERKVAVFQIRAARFERELGDARAEIDSLNGVVQALAALVATRRRS